MNQIHGVEAKAAACSPLFDGEAAGHCNDVLNLHKLYASVNINMELFLGSDLRRTMTTIAAAGDSQCENRDISQQKALIRREFASAFAIMKMFAACIDVAGNRAK